jgi:hypothetical protein
LIVISSDRDVETFRAAIRQAATATSVGWCMVCGTDIYEHDRCNLCCHNLHEHFGEIGPRLIDYYHRALARGFENPVLLLLNVFDREGKKLCEELKGADEMDTILETAEAEGRDMTFVPHAVAPEQLPVILGEHYDRAVIQPLLAMGESHILTCLVSEPGPLLITVPRQMPQN